MSRASSTERGKNGPARDEFGLLPRERAFADYYLVDQNATAAYKAAGYKSRNDQVAASSSSKLLRRDKVAAYVQSRLAAVRDAAILKPEDLIRLLANILNFDPAKCFDAKGALLPLHKMDEATRLALASVEVEDGKAKVGMKKVRGLDKLGAASLAMRYLGMFRELEAAPMGTVKHEHEHKGTVKVVSAAESYRAMLGGR